MPFFPEDPFKHHSSDRMVLPLPLILKKPLMGLCQNEKLNRIQFSILNKAIIKSYARHAGV